MGRPLPPWNRSPCRDVQSLSEGGRHNGGVAFIILFYSRLDEAYYLRFRDVERFWERGKSGGRKSFTYEELDKSWRIPVRRGALIHYLVTLRRDLETRD